MDYKGGNDNTTEKISIAVSVIVVFFIMLMLRDFLYSRHRKNLFEANVEKLASTAENRFFSILTRAGAIRK